MFANDILKRNPLRLLNPESEESILSDGEFGAITSRAGVGKTAFLVQLALDGLLHDARVLHVSVENPVSKIRLFYKEVFMGIAKEYQISNSNELWESLLPKRLIMTFQKESFNAKTLEERITNLMDQKIFVPDVIIFDDLPFDDDKYDMDTLVRDLKEFVIKYNLHAWFSIRTHREQETLPNGLPRRLQNLADLFEMVIQLVPEDKLVEVRAYRNGIPLNLDSKILLDPTTMLIHKQYPLNGKLKF